MEQSAKVETSWFLGGRGCDRRSQKSRSRKKTSLAVRDESFRRIRRRNRGKWAHCTRFRATEEGEGKDCGRAKRCCRAQRGEEGGVRGERDVGLGKKEGEMMRIPSLLSVLLSSAASTDALHARTEESKVPYESTTVSRTALLVPGLASPHEGTSEVRFLGGAHGGDSGCGSGLAPGPGWWRGAVAPASTRKEAIAPGR
jgi:hypothetical protein